MITELFLNSITITRENTNYPIGAIAKFYNHNNSYSTLSVIREVSLADYVLTPLNSTFGLTIFSEYEFLSPQNLCLIRPDLFGNNWDLLGNRITNQKDTLNNYQYNFIPVVQNNSIVKIGQKIGYANLNQSIKFWILATQEGNITNLKASSYSINDVIGTIDGSQIFLQTNAILGNLPLFSQYQHQSLINSTDIESTIIIGKKNKASLQSIKKITKNLQSKIIIYVSNKPKKTLELNEVCIVNNLKQSTTLTDNINRISYTFAIMGYDVIVINQTNLTSVFEIGFTINEDKEKGSVTLIEVE